MGFVMRPAITIRISTISFLSWGTLKKLQGEPTALPLRLAAGRLVVELRQFFRITSPDVRKG